MKVLFLSVTAGQGHNETAKAIMNCLEEQGIDCSMLDTLDYINPVLGKFISKSYLMSIKFTPAVYGRLYKQAEKLEKNEVKLSISKFTNKALAKKLINYINVYNPNVIVCTHIFPAQIITQIKLKGLISKTVGIITDFTIHPFWEETDLDIYITPSELLSRKLVKKGISADCIKPLGIPIKRKFAFKMSAKEARETLTIEDKDTVLVMSGSMGYGNVVKVIEQLDNVDLDFQIISVCGSNHHIKDKIDGTKFLKKVYNYGYVDNIDVMMDAANCIITKPGGLTVSESLAKNLPMILINPIPGQEDRNVEFLLNNGLAVKVSDTFPIDEAIYLLLSDGEKFSDLIIRIKNAAKPNATTDLCDLIINM